MTDAAPAPAGNADQVVTEPTGATVLDNPPPSGDVPPVTAYPNDWRDRMADWIAKDGFDRDKERTRLERFKNPEDVYKSLRNRDKQFDSGEYRRALPKDATEDDIAQYRKDNAIPETPDGYYKSMEGFVIGDDDKPIIDGFLEKVAHKGNWSPDQAKEAVSWYYGLKEQAQTEQAERDNKDRSELIGELGSEWGRQDFQVNMNLVNNFLSRAPESIREALKAARFNDGQAIWNNPDFMRFVVSMERLYNPAATLIPTTADPGKGVEERIRELEKMMGTKQWYSESRLHDEYQKLITARERLRSTA